MKVSDWTCPRDGDIVLTDDLFIFYVMGYDHPKDRVISYLKYIPKSAKKFFRLDWIPYEWELKDQKYVRPKMLYSPDNFKAIEDTFHSIFPDYLYTSKKLGKTTFAIPLNKVKKVYVPNDGLKRLLGSNEQDLLQKQALKLIKLLSEHSQVPLSQFGIHGSLLTSMHSNKSDIDIAVYGANNFFKVKEKVRKLQEKGKIKLLFEIETDKLRKNKGTFENQKFVFNAIRDFSEVQNNYEIYEYESIKSIEFKCTIIDDTQAIFRPAIYKITNYEALNKDSIISSDKIPTEIVSMIGEFRDVVHKGQIATVSGMLELVKNIKTKKNHHRVVVGSGIGKEFIFPIHF